MSRVNMTVNGVAYEVGEVAYWPPGNTFCIFFGPTPASSDSKPRMASPGVPLGKIVSGDISKLKGMGGSVSCRLVLPIQV